VCGRAEKDGNTFDLDSPCNPYDTVGMSAFRVLEIDQRDL